MAQKKLLRFEAIKSFSNVFQYPTGMSGKWKNHFGNNNPVTLELACGKGEYTVGLATMYPERNFIGIDLKGNRIYVGAKKSLEEHIHNTAFLRTQIDKIDQYFNPGEVAEIWITFPDPQIRQSKAKKRLTHPRFLRLYEKMLVPGGRIHLKTDSPLLFQFTLMVIEMYGLTLHESVEDISMINNITRELHITTHYEKLDIAKSNRIHYLCFSLPVNGIPAMDDILQQRIRENEASNN